MPTIAPHLNRVAASLISEMSHLAIRHRAINLVQGFPDFEPPAELVAAAVKALHAGHHQYAIGHGSPRFRQALAHKQSRFMGLEIDPETHLTVTCGGTEAIMAAILTLCSPGDKLITFSPYYENFAADALLVGVEPVFVPLQPPHFSFDPHELRRAFQQGGKVLAFCNPANPSGKVFSRQELQIIADLAHEYDAAVIVDEVYEHIVYAPYEHTYLASLPGMFERTISIGSLSKTYSVTGWRVGYLTAAAQVTQALRKVHDYLTIGAPAPLQEAAVTALNLPDSYYHELLARYTHCRDLFLGCLQQAGLQFIPPQGGIFVLVDSSPFGFPDDVAFCRWLIQEVGVAAVPGSSFFHEPVKNYIRFTFAKRDETLLAAGERLLKLKERL